MESGSFLGRVKLDTRRILNLYKLTQMRYIQRIVSLPNKLPNNTSAGAESDLNIG